MPDRRSTGLWLCLALLVAPAALGGSGIALFVGLTAMVAAVHRPTHERAMQAAAWAVSGGVLRAGLITLGAALIFQLVGLELAMLMAGDVLAYVELLAAVSVIAANSRLAPLKLGVGRAGRALGVGVARLARRSRSPRTARPRKVRPPSSEDSGPRPAFA